MPAPPPTLQNVCRVVRVFFFSAPELLPRFPAPGSVFQIYRVILSALRVSAAEATTGEESEH